MIDHDTWHRQQYEAALRTANREGPAWSELNDEQRENIRAVNHQHRDFMDQLGIAISTGNPLPDPFR